MKKSKSNIIVRKLAAVTAAFSLVLAGCGGQQQAGTAAPAAETTTAEETTTAAETSAEETTAAETTAAETTTAETTAAETTTAEETTAEETTTVEETTAEETTAAETSAAETSAAETTAEETTAAETTAEDTTAAETEAETSAEAAAEETTTGEAASEAGSPEAIYEAIGAEIDLSGMFLTDDDYIYNYYGIDPELLDGYVFAIADSAISADSVIIMKPKDQASADGLMDSLNMVKEAKEAEMQNYAPEAYEVAHASTVRQKDGYVYLVMSKDAAKIEKIIEDNLK